jgi:hypothetical protein
MGLERERPRHSTHANLRLVSKAACREVDAVCAAAHWVAGGYGGAPPATAEGVIAAARALAKTPNLTQLDLDALSGPELEQLLGLLAGAGTARPSTVARVRELSPDPLQWLQDGGGGPPHGVDGACALLRSLAHLPSLQVSGARCWPCTGVPACVCGGGGQWTG